MFILSFVYLGECMTSTTAPAGERTDYAATLSSQTKAFILAGVLLGLFLEALDQTIVATALPSIVREFQGIDLLAWVSTGYLLASTALVPIYGKLSDVIGRRAIVIWGISVFLLGSVLCGFAGSMLQLVIFRFIQGIGAAALGSTAFAIPADLYPPSDRARATGLIGGVFGIASVIGPFIGGFLTDGVFFNSNWRWIFYVNIPFGLLALGFILFKMPKLDSGRREQIDWWGTGLLLFAVVPLLLGLSLDKAVYPWTSPLIIGLFAVAAISTALLLLVESRAESPIIALPLFRNRTFALVIALAIFNGLGVPADDLVLAHFSGERGGRVGDRCGHGADSANAGGCCGGNHRRKYCAAYRALQAGNLGRLGACVDQLCVVGVHARRRVNVWRDMAHCAARPGLGQRSAAVELGGAECAAASIYRYGHGEHTILPTNGQRGWRGDLWRIVVVVVDGTVHGASGAGDQPTAARSSAKHRSEPLAQRWQRWGRRACGRCNRWRTYRSADANHAKCRGELRAPARTGDGCNPK